MIVSSRSDKRLIFVVVIVALSLAEISFEDGPKWLQRKGLLVTEQAVFFGFWFKTKVPIIIVCIECDI